MKKEIKEVDKKRGIVQITTVDERWYVRTIKNKEGVPEVKFIPSVTWIAGFYPKGLPFWKWLANKGWDEAEALKQAAGDKGSKVHQAIERLLQGKKVKMEDTFLNKTTGEEEELTLEEYECLMSFAKWFERTKPKVMANEIVMFNQREDYAGMVDFIGRINGQIYLVDFKTGQTIWPEYELQISAYSHLEFDWKALKIAEKEWKQRKLAVLQLGYRRNQNGYKFTEIEDKFDVFLSAKTIWQNECADLKPLQKDYPLSLKLR